MSTPASADSQPLLVDPYKPGKYPVRVSERLLDSTKAANYGYTSVQLNHTPKLENPYKTTITADESRPDTCHLQIVDTTTQDTYYYTGSHQPSETCVLIFDPETKSFILDKISTEFTFNLRSTPTNKSAKALASQYPQLETTAPDPSSSEDEPVDRAEEEGEDDDAPDPNNPWDYRHFLPKYRKPSPEEEEQRPRSPSPVIAPPTRRPSRPKNKQRQHGRPQVKQPPPSPPREEADADNEDSSLDADADGEVDEDDGELTIEYESIPKPRHRLGPAFPRVQGDGPRSLRSVASSVSPTGNANESEEESDEDADVIDDIKLPSPVRHDQVQEKEDSDMDVDEDGDEGDLEAELERELEKQVDAEDDDEGVAIHQGRYVEESSSESEEE